MSQRRENEKASDSEGANIVLIRDSAETADCEMAIEATGYGKFHYWLLFVCGWTYASGAIELICVSFLLPSAECDLQMTSQNKGWFSASTYIGMMTGGYIWGSLGDSMGRKRILMATMIMDAFFAILSSFSWNYIFFVVFRFLSAIGTGGSVPVVWSYFTEFQPKSCRGTMMCVMASFWTFGNILLAGLAWLFIPMTFSWEMGHLHYNSWRLFTAICAFTSLSVPFLLTSLPESPRYLLVRKENESALNIFRYIFSVNTGKDAMLYKYNNVSLERNIIQETEDKFTKVGLKSKIASSISQMFYHSKILFGRSLFRNTTVLMSIQFSLQFGYFGLWMWFPELFTRLQEYYQHHPNASLTVCEIINQEAGSKSNETLVPDQTQCGIPVADQVFIDSFILTIGPIPACIWTSLHMDKFGRKFFLILGMLGSGLCAFLVWIVKSRTDNVVVLSFFGFFMTLSFSAMNCFQTELFPTAARSTATGLTLIAARIGSILGTLLFGIFVDAMCALPILLIAGFFIIVGMLGFLLPNTSNIPLA